MNKVATISIYGKWRIMQFRSVTLFAAGWIYSKKWHQNDNKNTVQNTNKQHVKGRYNLFQTR